MHTKKLKWASPLFIIFLALASVFGATSAIIGSQKTTETPVMEKADAAAPTYVYLKWDGNVWKNWGASTSDVRLYIYGGSSSMAWGSSLNGSTTTINGSSYLKFNLSGVENYSSATNYIFHAWWPDDSTKQNRSNGTFDGTNNVFNITSSKGNDYQTGEWKCYADRDVASRTIYFDANSWGIGNDDTVQIRFFDDFENYEESTVSTLQEGTYRFYSKSTTKNWNKVLLHLNGAWTVKTSDLVIPTDGKNCYLTGSGEWVTTTGSVYSISRYRKVGTSSPEELDGSPDYIFGGLSYETPTIDPVFGYNTPSYWNSKADGSGTSYTSGWISNVGSNQQIYAVYSSIKKVAHLCGTMNSWTDNDSYLMTPTVDDQYVIDITLNADDEFKIHFTDGTNAWYGWSQVDQESAAFVTGAIEQGTDPDGTGARIKVKQTVQFEIYLKTTYGTNKLWIQLDPNVEADLYAQEFLSTITCSGQGSTTFAIGAWNKVGEAKTSMEYKFEHLTIGAQGKVKAATPSTTGSNIEKCLARYDAILSKYGYGTGSGQYHDFLARSPAVSSAYRGFALGNIFGSDDNNVTTIIIVVASSVALLSVTALSILVIKKRKHKEQE